MREWIDCLAYHDRGCYISATLSPAITVSCLCLLVECKRGETQKHDFKRQYFLYFYSLSLFSYRGRWIRRKWTTGTKLLHPSRNRTLLISLNRFFLSVLCKCLPFPPQTPKVKKKILIHEIHSYITVSLAWWLKCPPIVRDTRVQY